MFSATLAVNRKLSSATKATSDRSDADVDLADVGAVDQHRPLAGVVEPRDQSDQAGLARARGAHQGHGPARLDVEVDGGQGGRGVVVAQRHSSQLDLAAADRAGRERRAGSVSPVRGR